MNLDIQLILLVLSFTCERICTIFNQNNLGLYRTVSRLSHCYLQRFVRLLYTGEVRSPKLHLERANTGVVDVLFLGLKSCKCIVHQLFRGKTDHGRIIQ